MRVEGHSIRLEVDIAHLAEDSLFATKP